MKDLLFLALAMLPWMAHAQYKSQVWSPDNGNGTYQNPVINADYSDPDVIAVGEDYYLTASSFECFPGLPILHSKDLVNWEILSYALPHPYRGAMARGKGVWAPSIRYHNGEYYIYWGDPDRGVYRVKAKHPEGPWEKPVLVIKARGIIDPCPLWDDDGKCYLVNGWAASRSGFNSVLTVRELSSDGPYPVGDPVIVFDGGNDNHTAEGPKFYKRDGWYWILCPAGGVAKGWQLAMRSKSPYGPYECKKVLSQGRTEVNGPHQGAWVHTAFGEDWFLHFQDKGCYGRVLHLQPVDWTSGWPIMGKKGQPVLTYRKPKSGSTVIMNPLESDEFNRPRLGLQWQWEGPYDPLFGMPMANGMMRLYTYKLVQRAGVGDVIRPAQQERNLWTAPNLLLQKTPADQFTVTAKIRFASKADHQYGGLIMMGQDYSDLVVERIGENFQLQQRTCIGADNKGKETVSVLATLKPTARDQIPYSPAIYLDIYLRMSVDHGKCRFAYSMNGKKFQDVGDIFTMKEGKWIGAKMGFVSEEINIQSNCGWIDADWFRVAK